MRKPALILRTCFVTCLAVLFSSTAFAQDGLELLHRMQKALGGADRLAAIRDYEDLGQGNAWNDAGRPIGQVQKRVRWTATKNFRVDQSGLGNTYVLYFDGSTGWEILPERGTNRTTGTAVDLVGDELTFARQYATGFALETWRGLWLADRIPGYTIASPSPNVIRITNEGQTTDIVLDPATWLPLKHVSVSPVNPAQPIPSEMHFDAWQVVEGIHLPSRRTDYRNGIKIRQGDFVEIRINTGIRPEDLAVKPADFSPVFPSR